MTDSGPFLPRRQLLAGGAAALTAAGLGGLGSQARAQGQALPPYAGWKDAGALTVHSSNTLETRRSAFGASVITPAEQLYVRNNLPPPDAVVLADRGAWELAVEGVRSPRTVSLRELRTLGIESVATVLQCSGNGRGFFPNKPSGTPWKVGAAGCVLWTGVPLRAVAQALGGVADGSKFITGTGGEKLPEGIDAKSVVVERSVPIQALGDALLAWEMNGSPLSLAHGGPLRLILPGYQGVNNIKYIKRLSFTANETDAKIMSHGYRITPPGATAGPSQPSVLEMNVKSWINSPDGEGAMLTAGRVQIVGVAFGGTQSVKHVEVSIDGGKTWREAQLFGPDLGRFAWRQFVLAVDLPSGSHVLACRATDASGHTQPQARLENTGGYNNNSWADHAVKVTVA